MPHGLAVNIAALQLVNGDTAACGSSRVRAQRWQTYDPGAAYRRLMIIVQVWLRCSWKETGRDCPAGAGTSQFPADVSTARDTKKKPKKTNQILGDR